MDDFLMDACMAALRYIRPATRDLVRSTPEERERYFDRVARDYTFFGADGFENALLMHPEVFRGVPERLRDGRRDDFEAMRMAAAEWLKKRLVCRFEDASSASEWTK